jgi:Ni/Fe-hydrogenase 1 B-type cytochrome subunit
MADTTDKVLRIEPGDEVFGRKYVWQLPVRLTHWANAIAIAFLFCTGMYIASPVLMPTGEAWKSFLMGKVRLIHFSFAYLLLCGWLLRSYWFWVGNNYARSGFPMVWKKVWWEDLGQQGWRYLKTTPGAPHLGHNSLAGLSYTLIVVMTGAFQLVTGFALYSEIHPHGFWGHAVGWVIPLLGGPQTTRTWHHMAAWMFLVFFIVHVYIVLFDGVNFRSGLISSMVSGFKYYKDGDKDNASWIS